MSKIKDKAVLRERSRARAEADFARYADASDTLAALARRFFEANRQRTQRGELRMRSSSVARRIRTRGLLVHLTVQAIAQALRAGGALAAAHAPQREALGTGMFRGVSIDELAARADVPREAVQEVRDNFLRNNPVAAEAEARSKDTPLLFAVGSRVRWESRGDSGFGTVVEIGGRSRAYGPIRTYKVRCDGSEVGYWFWDDCLTPATAPTSAEPASTPASTAPPPFIVTEELNIHKGNRCGKIVVQPRYIVEARERIFSPSRPLKDPPPEAEATELRLLTGEMLVVLGSIEHWSKLLGAKEAL
jgi:hypothetical protein